MNAAEPWRWSGRSAFFELRAVADCFVLNTTRQQAIHPSARHERREHGIRFERRRSDPDDSPVRGPNAPPLWFAQVSAHFRSRRPYEATLRSMQLHLRWE